MASLFLTATTYITRLLVTILKLFGSSGTSLPGLWVELYFPQLITAYSRSFSTIILITGTNGKTTTQLTLSKALKLQGYHVVHNSSGANMLRGLAATLLTHGPAGSVKDVLLLETEEATMPKITSYITATHIVVTNLFRDQLDAYGELDTTARYITQACQNNPSAKVIMNADDGSLDSIRTTIPNKQFYFSLGNYAKEFMYEVSLKEKMQASVKAFNVEIQKDFSTKVVVEDTFSETLAHIALTYQPPGIYNAYNLLAAYAVLRLLQIPPHQAVDTLSQVSPPFGRGEIITFTKNAKVRTFHLFLVKNPAGFTQVWKMLQPRSHKNMIIALNDNIADGRDVSWIWDIDIEGTYDTAKKIESLIFTGHRAGDIAIRFKYAEVDAVKNIVEPKLQNMLEMIVEGKAAQEQWFVLCTYTALNQFRRLVAHHTPVKQFTT